MRGAHRCTDTRTERPALYLKSLTAKGFKSFADRIHMQLEPGVTVIVGPNGSAENLGVLDARSGPVDCFEAPQKERDATFPVCPLCTPVVLSADGHNLPLKELVRRVGAQMERALLLQALELTEGNKAHAARLLQIDYKTIHSKLKEHNIFSIPLIRGQ